ncbi:hypothetical protein PQ469_29290 [Mucilaginibacter sp. KACC 22773]|uniref:hypothetical protein n=1 Tax=Mucilaginibacter sp. KACC 22773 TaxID=3025671 RepID=UPI002366934F|nr:hypothetical protein [Mucilaginibacter sp. KACC 22773]WDF77984.1 hypothetical protein PQ469_29290 [Mucilaginibacter sp. KACC 22773]
MIIIPFKSVGSLHFSDTREDVRKKLNEKFTSGVKGKDNYKDYYDYFKQSELFVYYDEKGNINAFEYFKPNPIFNNVNLLETHYRDLVSLFQRFDPELTINYDEFTSLKYGIGVNTIDDPDEENAIPQSVVIFKRGYFDFI